MNTLLNKVVRMLVALILAGGGLALTGSSALAADVSIELCAETGNVTMPDSVSVPIWGFGIPTTPGDCSTAVANLPGPVLEVNEGDVVTVTVNSDLGGHVATFEVPGLPVTPLGGNQFRFTASRAGTFTYQSDGDSGRQMAMGLYGALIVRPVGESAGFSAGQCSNTAGTAYGSSFDGECVLVLSSLDPNFNADPDNFNMYNYHATYWLINGKSYPDTAPLTAAEGSTVLLRYVNAGYDNTSMMLLGMHEQVVARDAYLLNNSFLADAETIPAGATEDAFVTVLPYSSAPTSNGYPLYNRQLHEGMMTFFQP